MKVEKSASKEDVTKLRVKQLKSILADRGVTCDGCLEKGARASRRARGARDLMRVSRAGVTRGLTRSGSSRLAEDYVKRVMATAHLAEL